VIAGRSAAAAGRRARSETTHLVAEGGPIVCSPRSAEPTGGPAPQMSRPAAALLHSETEADLSKHMPEIIEEGSDDDGPPSVCMAGVESGDYPFQLDTQSQSRVRQSSHGLPVARTALGRPWPTNPRLP
jgi:hypothetical protein